MPEAKLMSNFSQEVEKYFKNEIWKCRNTYVNSFGESVNSKEDYYVFIKSGPYFEDKDMFVRVNLISTNIKFRTNKDVLIEDGNLLGKSFIIETWNEQPVLTTVLDKMICKIDDLPPTSSQKVELTEKQKEFRKDELRRAAFLYQSILSNISFHEQNSKKNIRLSSSNWILSIAASIIGLGLFITQPGKLSSDEVFSHNVKPYKNVIALEYSHQDLVRGSECILPEFTSTECKIIDLALTKYNAHEFADAAELFNSIEDINKKNEDIFFIYAVSQLFSNQLEEAINSFNIVVDQNDEKYKSDGLYYLAASYIKSNKVLKARKILRQLKKEDSKYLEDKNNLLKELRWF